MKKTYIAPVQRVHQLNMAKCVMLGTSDTDFKEENGWETKGENEDLNNPISIRNVWDEEW